VLYRKVTYKQYSRINGSPYPYPLPPLANVPLLPSIGIGSNVLPLSLLILITGTFDV
jgi:hypothetical protein